jgi:hypothetical protein
MTTKKTPPDLWFLNCVEFQRTEGVDTLLLRDGIEKIVEPKGKGWKRGDADDWDSWDVVWKRKAR